MLAAASVAFYVLSFVSYLFIFGLNESHIP